MKVENLNFLFQVLLKVNSAGNLLFVVCLLTFRQNSRKWEMGECNSTMTSTMPLFNTRSVYHEKITVSKIQDVSKMYSVEHFDFSISVVFKCSQNFIKYIKELFFPNIGDFFVKKTSWIHFFNSGRVEEFYEHSGFWLWQLVARNIFGFRYFWNYPIWAIKLKKSHEKTTVSKIEDVSRMYLLIISCAQSQL